MAIVSPDDTDPLGSDLLATARQSVTTHAPGAVIVTGPPDADGIPLLTDRPLVDGGAAAYVCRAFVCDRPVTDPDALRAAMASQRA